jgi:hypothetical protein
MTAIVPSGAQHVGRADRDFAGLKVHPADLAVRAAHSQAHVVDLEAEAGTSDVEVVGLNPDGWTRVVNHNRLG